MKVLLNSLVRLAKTMPRGRCIPASREGIFSFAKNHQLTRADGALNEDGMVLVHLTDYLPRKGYIDTARSAVGAPRDSVHFAVNHAVESHFNGDWSEKKLAFILPMKAARAIKENNFTGGIAADFYSQGRIKIPEGSVIVRLSQTMKPGLYRISDASKIDEFKDLKGVKVIETAADDISETTNDVLKKMGYEVRSSDTYHWGSTSDFDGMLMFSKFLRKNGMKPAWHGYTPNAKIEMIMEVINLLANKANRWQFQHFEWGRGDVIWDAKELMLNALKYVDGYAKSSKLPINFDIKTLVNIIETSKNPQEAVKLLQSRMGISSYMMSKEYIAALTDENVFSSVKFNFEAIADSPILRKIDKYVANFLENPSEKTFEVFSSL